MNKKFLKELVKNSYQDGILDEQIVNTIAEKLSRKELKEYIHALKLFEQSRIIIVESAQDITQEQKQMFEDTFKNKKTRFVTNASLMTGVRITDNDMIYEANLKNIFAKIVQHIEEQYD